MKDLEEWIERVKQSHPDLKGFSICPFARGNTYKIVRSPIDDIKPLDEEFGVVIFVVEDDLDIEYGYKKIEELNQKYSKYKLSSLKLCTFGQEKRTRLESGSAIVIISFEIIRTGVDFINI